MNHQTEAQIENKVIKQLQGLASKEAAIVNGEFKKGLLKRLFI